jgi:hypothetical protein
MGISGRNHLSLQMVGTVHRDPQGKRKLLRLLQKEQPFFISVEISPYSRMFRVERSAAFRSILRKNLLRIQQEEGISWRKIISHRDIQAIFFLLKEPYEWGAAKAYAEQTGGVLKDIDLSCYAEEKLSYLPELVSRENLQALLRLPSPDMGGQIEAHYRWARSLFSHPPSVWFGSHEFQARDTIMAERIRGFVHLAGGRKVIHIGGWEHLIEFRDGLSLFKLLQDLHPQRILLSDVENGSSWNRKGMNSEEVLI